MTVTPGVESLTVHWNAPVDARTYIVYWRTGAQHWDASRSSGILLGTSRSPSYTISGLVPGMSTAVEAVARNQAGDVIATGSAIGTPEEGLTILTVTVRSGGDSLTVGWNEAPGGRNYIVQWKSDGEAWHPDRRADVTTNSHTITGLTEGAEYTVRVIADAGANDVLRAFASADERRREADLRNYDPFSSVSLDDTHAWFENGDAGEGITLGLTASKSFRSAERPFFAAVFGQLGKADDELALPEFRGLSAGVKQDWYRGGLVVGWEADGDRHRMLYGLLGYEQNDIDVTAAGTVVSTEGYKGSLYGGGVFLQYTAKNAVDLRITRSDYDDADDASYTTYSARNNHLLGAGFMIYGGVSYNTSSLDSTAIHVGLTWMFE